MELRKLIMMDLWEFLSQFEGVKKAANWLNCCKGNDDSQAGSRIEWNQNAEELSLYNNGQSLELGRPGRVDDLEAKIDAASRQAVRNQEGALVKEVIVKKEEKLTRLEKDDPSPNF